MKLSWLGSHPYQLNSVKNILNDKDNHQLQNFVSEQYDNHNNTISSDLIQNQVLDTAFETNWRGFESVTILMSQVPVKLIEPVFLCILIFLKWFQFCHQKFSLLKPGPVHFEVIALAKATAH